MVRLARWSRSHKALAAGVILAALLVFGAAAVGTALATDSPDFCYASCHEMRPYHDAWSKGPHADVTCISCHVEAGIPARISHKVVALKELWTHVTEEPAFPLTTVTPVPDERCIRCHEKVDAKDTGFDHADHATQGTCQSCHATAGHRVSTAALKRIGVLNTSPKAATVATGVATVDGGVANVDGHVSVSCTRCHDLAKTGCPTCHEPKHESTGPAAKTEACQTCHAPGEEFVFVHPTDRTDCAACHQPPTEKHDYEQACTSCHAQPATTWAFTHPTRSATCTDCHTRPAKHESGACATCHRKTGTSWAFTHPTSSSCSSCHSRPARHRSGSCTSCHRNAGVSWAFSHPGSSSRCTSCHSRPSGHRSGSCSSCHRTGASWAFRHSSSSRCSSCHKAPSNHFGSSCSSCHSPSRKFSSARFSHPRIRGGEHTYRSFACTNCHPGGYGSHTCTKCHKSANGPDDDDD